MKVDMSPEAIDARLTLTSELLNLCLSLGKAKPVPQNSDAPKETAAQNTSSNLNETTN
ncbi:MAG: hypothetical protein AB1757_26010 [Acidobacteriota bacterium]